MLTLLLTEEFVCIYLSKPFVKMTSDFYTKHSGRGTVHDHILEQSTTVVQHMIINM